MRGRKLSEETKTKIGQNNALFWKGKHFSEEYRKKISEGRKGQMVGKDHPNWKGGITKASLAERIKFRREMQEEIYKRDNYTCQLCGVRGVSLQVDHIQSWAEYVELRFNMDNCRTLCAKCHYKITFGREMPANIKTWGQNLRRRKLL